MAFNEGLFCVKKTDLTYLDYPLVQIFRIPWPLKIVRLGGAVKLSLETSEKESEKCKNVKRIILSNFRERFLSMKSRFSVFFQEIKIHTSDENHE